MASRCSMVHQHDVNRADVAVVFVRGLGDSGDADGVPFAHENFANPRATLSRLIFVAAVCHLVF